MKDITIKSTAYEHKYSPSWDKDTVFTDYINLFLKLKISNCSKVRFIDITDPTRPVEHMSTDIIGNINVDISSPAEHPTHFDSLSIRTDKIITATNTKVQEILAFECTPTIKNARITNGLTIVDSAVKLVNCSVTGLIELRFCDGYKQPILYLQNCTFKPTDVKVITFSHEYLYGGENAKILEKNFDLDLIIVGLEPEQLSEIAPKINFFDRTSDSQVTKSTSQKVVLSKDGKGIHLASSSFDSNEAPETVPDKYDIDNPENYVEKEEEDQPIYSFEDVEDEKDDDFEQPTDIIQFPTPEKPDKPDKPENPTKDQDKSSENPTQKPDQPPSSSDQENPNTPVVTESKNDDDNTGDNGGDNSDKGKKSPSIAMIAGIAVVVLGAVVAIVVFVLLKRKKKYEASTDVADINAADQADKKEKENLPSDLQSNEI